MASFTSSSLLKCLTPKNSFNFGNKWKSLEASSEQYIAKNMCMQCADVLYLLDDPHSMAVRPRPVLAAHLGYSTLWYNLCRGIWNSAVIWMCAECVPSCFFGYLCDFRVGVWCLFLSWTVQRINYQLLHVLCTAAKPQVEELQGYMNCPSSFNRFLNVDQSVLATFLW